MAVIWSVRFGDLRPKQALKVTRLQRGLLHLAEVGAEEATCGGLHFVPLDQALFPRLGDAGEDEHGDDGAAAGEPCDGIEGLGDAIDLTTDEAGEEEGEDVAEAEEGLERGAALGGSEFGGEGEISHAINEEAEAEGEVGDGEA
jgi:hypothetical protein